MKYLELRKKFFDFFESKKHKIIASASLIPENDISTLFISAGMQPLIPYISGKEHPQGDRLVNIQKCIRTIDIDEVGDESHLTFFEMMGNWSLQNSYWKKESIEMSWEFLTGEKWLNLDKKNFSVSVFKGNSNSLFDEEAFDIWKKLGIPEEKIEKLGEDDNWWKVGETGLCGPDTEIFYNETEVWNNVFMMFNRRVSGELEKLENRAIDTGMGLERIFAVLNGEDDIYRTELFLPIIKKIEEISGEKYEDNKREFRIIADHIKASVFILSEKIEPSNTERGYVLRRLIRRAIRYGNLLGIRDEFLKKISDPVFDIYSEIYPELEENKEFIFEQLEAEEKKFGKTLIRGLEKLREDLNNFISGKDFFDLYQTYGFPIELAIEELKLKERIMDSLPKVPKFVKDSIEKPIELKSKLDEASKNIQNDLKIIGQQVNDVVKYIPFEKIEKIKKQFEEELKKHQELSRTAIKGKFKGGLADNSEQAKKYHTTAHLLLAALKNILGDDVEQRGGNINSERLRFDFSYPQKLTDEQKKEIEDWINDKISKKLEVEKEEMSLEEARNSGATGIFDEKYGDPVSVYSILEKETGETFSREICGGPHIENTSELGRFKIIKEESASSGIRRIKAVLG